MVTKYFPKFTVTAPLSNKAFELPGAGGRVQREAAADGHQRELEEEVAQEQVRQLPGGIRRQGKLAAAQGRALMMSK